MLPYPLKKIKRLSVEELIREAGSKEKAAAFFEKLAAELRAHQGRKLCLGEGQLRDLAEIMTLPKERRCKEINSYCEVRHISKKLFYRLAAKGGYQSGRKRRSDAGRKKLPNTAHETS